MVNMSPESAYYLRRQPGAEGFRRAWDAALDFGLARLKDEAFERAINGYLVPIFTGGTLRGFRRKKNDRLLMFCLRHYGHDAEGRRVTINYFNTNAHAAAAASSSPAFARGRGTARMPRWKGPRGADRVPLGPPRATAQATAAGPHSRRPHPAARDDQSAALINNFEPAILDDQAQAEIQAVLAACAERRRALDPLDDPDVGYVAAGDAPPFAGALEGFVESDDFIPFREGELSWEGMGEGGVNAEIETVLAGIEARKRAPPKERAAIAAKEKAKVEAEARAQAEREAARQSQTRRRRGCFSRLSRPAISRIPQSSSEPHFWKLVERDKRRSPTPASPNEDANGH